MKLGLSLPQIGHLAHPDAVREVAVHAEAIGFDSLWVMERLLAPTHPRDPYPGTPDLSWPEQFGVCLDPLETLTFAAAHTTRVRLGTSVLNVPWYRPLLLARRLATLDVLSGGRVQLGAGLGWSTDEFEALGIPMDRLGQRLEDHLDAIETAWSADPVAYRGDGYRVAPSAVGPKPIQRPRPPLYLGAFTDAGLRRIARRADGWITVFLPEDVIRSMRERMRQLAGEAGRDPDDLRVVVRANPYVSEIRVTDASMPFCGTIQQIADEIARYGDVGVDELHIDLQFSPGIGSVQALLDAAGGLRDLALAAIHGLPVGFDSRGAS